MTRAPTILDYRNPGNHQTQPFFFCGEPLPYFDRIVIDFINGATQLCHIKGITLSIHFTTNAFLLTGTILAQLKGPDTSFHITIDGNRHIHETIRKTRATCLHIPPPSGISIRPYLWDFTWTPLPQSYNPTSSCKRCIYSNANDESMRDGVQTQLLTYKNTPCAAFAVQDVEIK